MLKVGGMGLEASEWDIGSMSRFCALKLTVKA